jgi:hypothetical protein
MQSFESKRDNYRHYVERVIRNTSNANAFYLRAQLWRHWITQQCFLT